jgi:hypothetical protein
VDGEDVETWLQGLQGDPPLHVVTANVVDGNRPERHITCHKAPSFKV